MIATKFGFDIAADGQRSGRLNSKPEHIRQVARRRYRVPEVRSAIGVPMAEFMKLTKFPIIIFYGDFIPEKPSDNPGQDGWRVRLEMTRKWRDVVNRHERRCRRRAPARDRDSGQHALSNVGPEQRPDCGSDVEVPFRKEAGLIRC